MKNILAKTVRDKPEQQKMNLRFSSFPRNPQILNFQIEKCAEIFED